MAGVPLRGGLGIVVCRILKSTRSASLQTGREAWARPSLRPPERSHACWHLDFRPLKPWAMRQSVPLLWGSHSCSSAMAATEVTALLWGRAPVLRGIQSRLRGDLDAMLWPPMQRNLGRKRPVGIDKCLEAPPLIQTRPVPLPAWCCLHKDRRVFRSILQLIANNVGISSQLFPTQPLGTRPLSPPCSFFSEFPQTCWSEAWPLRKGPLGMPVLPKDALIGRGHFLNPKSC